MNQFWIIVTNALWESSLELLAEAQKEHDRMVNAENVQYAEIVDTLDSLKGVKDEYTESLAYDLTRIRRDQERRLDTLTGHKKTIELYQSWDRAIAA